MKRDFEIFFVGQQVSAMTEGIMLSSSLIALPLLDPCQRNLDNPPTFLLSGVYIIGMENGHQEVGILYIGEHNRTVSLYSLPKETLSSN